MLDAVRDPVHMLFDRDEHITQDRRAARPSNREQIWEARHSQTEVRDRTILPFIPKCYTVSSADVNPGEGAGHRVESCRQNQAIELEYCFTGTKAERR